MRIDCDGSVAIEVPMLAVSQVFYRTTSDALLISSDARLLSDANTPVDEHALYSLLQFGAIAPPLSPWKDVKRFRPGSRSVIAAGAATSAETDLVEPPPAGPLLPTIEEQADEVGRRLDDTLRLLSPDERPVILFSGGVDSALLAARAAALGWRDTRLVHFSMGQSDPETPLAQQIAETLGLKMLTIPRPDSSATSVLDQARELYACPFVDHSAAPMAALAQAVVREFGDETRTVLDGTGADGAFGLFRAVPGWQKLYGVPRTMRRIAGALYKAGDFALKPSGLERRLRLLRRASQMPLIAAAVAQNPLHGIAYHFDNAVRERVHEMMQDVVRRPLPGAPLASWFSALDLLITCAGIFAQKDKSIFDDSPHTVAYPYLQPPLVRFALQHGHLWAGLSERKVALKTLLARHIPKDLIYRPKSGFVAPLAELFAEPGVLRLMDAVCTDAGALTGRLDARAWSRLRDAAAARRPLPPQTYTFMWGVLFLTRWLRA